MDNIGQQSPRLEPTVILRHCADYDPVRIAEIIGEGMDRLGQRPRGRTLIKPNIVMSGARFPNAFTRPEFTEGVLRALERRAGPEVEELAVGEHCGVATPTRFAFKQAGYREVFRRFPDLKVYHYDEETHVEVPLTHEGRLRDSIYVPRPVAQADFIVNCPKFKAHPWVTMTLSMKNLVGMQDDRYRLVDHDYLLHRKVLDLQYVVQSRFIAVDGICAGSGRMLTPQAFPLQLIVMGNNQAAVDAVCCRIVGVDPYKVEYLALAHEHGFGPIDLDEIVLEGDVSFEEARERGGGFRVGRIRVDDYFKGTKIRAYGGAPPGGELDYCWGGCPGGLEEAIEILRLYDESTDERLPRLHIVFGAYDKPIPAGPGERIIFVGDCATWKGTIGDKEYDVPSRYINRANRNPLKERAAGVFMTMLLVYWQIFKARKDPVMRLKGCPVGISEQVLLMVRLAGLKNPYSDRTQLPAFILSYLAWRFRQLINFLLGRPRYVSGPTLRGEAAPGADRLPVHARPTVPESLGDAGHRRDADAAALAVLREGGEPIDDPDGRAEPLLPGW